MNPQPAQTVVSVSKPFVIFLLLLVITKMLSSDPAYSVSLKSRFPEGEGFSHDCPHHTGQFTVNIPITQPEEQHPPMKVLQN